MTYVYSTSKYGYLKDAVLTSLFQITSGYRNEIYGGMPQTEFKFETGELARKVFPDGETYHRLNPGEVENSDVIIIGGTINDRVTLELFDMACSAVEHGARSLTLVIPFFGYSTMERAVKPGEIVKAKTRAILLSAIPRAAFGNKIMMVDLHQDGVLHYFERGIRTVHIYGKPLIMEICKTIRGENIGRDFVLGSTDAGRAKWIESLANDMSVDCAIIIKRRNSGTATEIVGINADVKGKDVIIYDDMIRTGGSLIKAAGAYSAAGAENIYAIATHGIFPDDSLMRLYNSGLFKKIVTTDTHPNVFNAASTAAKDFLEVKSIATIIAKNITDRPA